MRLTEEGVAKVVPQRVYCAAFHPSHRSLLMSAGDTAGNVGLWGLVRGHIDRKCFPVAALTFTVFLCSGQRLGG